MPFEPRHPGSDQPEEHLPDELFVLGEQLRDDALHLAEKYPAPLPATLSSANSFRLLEDTQNKVELITQRSRRRSVSRFSGLLIGLSLVVLLFGFSWTAYHWSFQNDQRRSAAIDLQKIDQQIAPVEIVVDTTSSAANPPIDQLVPHHRGTDEIHIETQPAAFLQEVSVPEMEGLFDLWEQEPSPRARLSI